MQPPASERRRGRPKGSKSRKKVTTLAPLWLSGSETEWIFNLSRSTRYRLAEAGRLHPIRLAPRLVKYDLSELLELSGQTDVAAVMQRLNELRGK
jgi:hypothetical protein